LRNATIDSFTGKYAWLSNFWETPVKYRGHRYPTLEHAYQAAKAASLRDRKRIMAAGSPGEAKRLGRQVLLRPDWEQVKLGVMWSLLQRKFKDPVLRNQLLATGDAELVEGNWWHDSYWGNCSCVTCAWQPPGLNWLGRLLMLLRSQLALRAQR